MTVSNYLAQALEIQRSVGSTSQGLERLIIGLNQLAALALLVVLSPLMLCVALLVWKGDRGPLLFGHYRVGRDGRLFRCLKFRTMRTNSAEMLAEILRTDPAARAEWNRDHKLIDDPRVTSIGNLLRRTSLDELPQLLNVIRGEMALVGPRPVTVEELTRYGRVRWHYLSVQPGITGLWQVSGRNDTTYEERVELDRKYVEMRSPWVDLWVLIKTVKVVLMRQGAR
jgi:exopolysaccharide production protein ExoY